jgi:hypothetical protein
VFAAYSSLAIVRGIAEVRDDEDCYVWTDVVDPGGNQRSDGGSKTKLFFHLSDETGRRCFSGLELSARELPLVAFVV